MCVKMKYGKNVVLFTLFAMNLVDQPAPEVTIAQGTLAGKISIDGTFFEYMGIPYASTNSSTRFQAPSPPPIWEGVFKATEEIYSCPQVTPIGIMGSEDCLKINVYVPAFAQRPLPVMVYIHGGAFILGSGGKLVYAPEFLVKHDVIIVTFNYRLGALGFLCLGIKEAPGNAGLKDQLAALKWIKSNIAAFGGDPDNITVFGESAGAASTAILIASEVTNGLFNRAIIQSGSSITNWSVNKKPVWIASLLTKELGYNTEDPNEIYKILSKMHFKDLAKLIPKKPLGMYFDTQLLHLPCIETFPDVESVLTELPQNLILRNPKNISLILGSVSNEGLFLVDREDDETLQERNTHYLFASDLEFENEDEAAAVAKNVNEFYFGKELISLKSLMNLSAVYTHLYFEIPSILEGEMYLNSGNNGSVYYYYFDYEGDRNLLKGRTKMSKESGACHGDDLFYLFDIKLYPFRVNKRDQKMIDLMTTLWTNFAKYGDPTPSSQTNLSIRWQPSDKNKLRFLYLQDQPRMGPLPNPKAYALWKDIYTKYRRTNVTQYL